MRHITVRDLSRSTAEVLDLLESTGEPVVISRAGRFVAMIFPSDANEIEDFILSNAPDFIESLRAADEDVKHGQTKDLRTVFNDLDRSTRARDPAIRSGRARSAKARSARTRARPARARSARGKRS